MIGYFIIQSFDAKQDSAGAKVGANVKSQMDNNITGFLFLPPYLRQNQSNIKIGSVVFGVLDDVSGIGAALCGVDDSDFGYFLNADYTIKKALNVGETIEAQSNIKSNSGDVIAGNITLKGHVHTATLTVEGPEASGTTDAPIPEPVP